MTPINRTFYTVGSDFWSYDRAAALAAAEVIWQETGHVVGVEEYTESEAYGADHDPKMFTNPEARRAPKVGRRYPLLRR